MKIDARKLIELVIRQNDPLELIIDNLETLNNERVSLKIKAIVINKNWAGELGINLPRGEGVKQQKRLTLNQMSELLLSMNATLQSVVQKVEWLVEQVTLINHRLDVIEADIKLMKSTPTMQRELALLGKMNN